MAENSNKRAAEIIDKMHDAQGVQQRKSKHNPYSDDRKVFAEAMLAFAKENIQIPLTGSAGVGNGTRRYPELPKIVSIVRPRLADHGLFFHWQSEPFETGKVKVTCILECAGSATMRTSTAILPADPGKSAMNAAQAVVSATTYARRVTLFDVTGLVGDVDTDGEGLEAPQHSAESPKLKELRKLLEDNPGLGDEDAMLAFYKADTWAALSEPNVEHAIKTIKARIARAGSE